MTVDSVMAPKKIVETASETLSALLNNPTSDLADFLRATGPGGLKLINTVLAAVAEGQTLVTLADADGTTLAFYPRPAGLPQEAPCLNFLPVPQPVPQPAPIVAPQHGPDPGSMRVSCCSALETLPDSDDASN